MSSFNEYLEGLVMKRAISSPHKTCNEEVDGVIKMYNNFVRIAPKKHSKTRTWAQNLRYYFRDYCCCSGVHGVRYLGERGRYMIEKLVWAIVITLVWYFCINLILKAYNKWITSPVIVTFAAKETAISRIPFPAVTICPEVKFEPEIFNFTDVVLRRMSQGYITPDEKRYYEAMSLICDGIAGRLVNVNGNTNLTVSDSALDAMMHVFPAINPKLSFLKWGGRRSQINSTLSQSFTSEGVCYSFNMLHFEDILVDPEEYVSKRSIKDTKSKMWTLEDGYPERLEVDTYPARTFMSGRNGGFEFDIYTNHSHLDYLCKDSLQGFKVTLHLPSELPNMDRHFRLPLDQAVLVAIKPRMITVSQELKSYKPEDRLCYFATERKLKFFRSYTQQNCFNECLSNYTLIKCGCVPFYMPKLKAWPICGPASYICVYETKVWYLVVEQVEIAKTSSKTNNPSGCNCLPSCTSLEYDVEISQTDWNWKKGFVIVDRVLREKLNITPDYEYKKSHMSRLHVFYREMQFLSSERHEMYGLLDFVSNTGGLLGLFVGFSVTSAIEILYFLTLRLVCNINKFGKGFWSGQWDTSDQ